VNRGAGGPRRSPRQRSYEGATHQPVYTEVRTHALGASRGTESAGGCPLLVIILPSWGNALLKVEDILWAYYGDNLARLQEVKRKYDPEVVDAAVGHVTGTLM
jgi:hypothetical protein